MIRVNQSRLMLVFVKEYPALLSLADKQIQEFINFDTKRVKQVSNSDYMESCPISDLSYYLKGCSGFGRVLVFTFGIFLQLD